MIKNKNETLETKKICFIFAYGRTGSSGLHSCLDNHYQILTLPMELKFHQMFNLSKHLKSTEKVFNFWIEKTKLKRFKNNILYGNYKEKFTNLDFNFYKKKFKKFLYFYGLSRKGVFYAIHHAYAVSIGLNIKNVKVIVEFCAGSLNLDYASEDFNDFKVINVMRDFKSAFSSEKLLLLENHSFIHYFNKNKLPAIFHYNKMLERKIYNLNYIEKKNKNILTINTEDFHQNNKEEISKIVNFLGIELKNSLFENTLGGHKWDGNSSLLKSVKTGHYNPMSNINLALNENEKIIINFIFRKFYLKFYNKNYKFIGNISFIFNLFKNFKYEFDYKTNSSIKLNYFKYLYVFLISCVAYLPIRIRILILILKLKYKKNRLNIKSANTDINSDKRSEKLLRQRSKNIFFFICGAGKCGTTLVKCIIDGHKDVNVYPVELTNLIYQLNRLKKDKNKQKCYDFCEKFLKLKKEKIGVLTDEIYINLNKSLEKILNIINNHLFLNDKPTVFDVTDPSSLKYLKNFKKSKVIHLIRNPVDSLNSQFFERYIKFKNITSLNKWVINSHLERMKESFLNLNKISNDKKFHNRYLLIKLEDLQEKKSLNIRLICKFLNLKYSKNLYQLTLSGKNYYAASNLQQTNKIKILKHKKNYLTKFETSLANNIIYSDRYYKLNKKININFTYFEFIKRNLKYMLQFNLLRFFIYSYFGIIFEKYKLKRN